MSVSKIVNAIRGTEENGYRDGILEITRQSAAMTAQTIVSGIASNAMLETCAENSDAIDAIKFVTTLDAKTYPFCGSFDGKNLETGQGRAYQTTSPAPELPLHRHFAHRDRGRNRMESNTKTSLYMAKFTREKGNHLNKFAKDT